jgi:hypothetical protein
VSGENERVGRALRERKVHDESESKSEVDGKPLDNNRLGRTPTGWGGARCGTSCLGRETRQITGERRRTVLDCQIM